MPKKRSAAQLAQDNLDRVVKAVKGKDGYERIEFRAGGFTFIVWDGMIMRKKAGRYRGKTCWALRENGWEPVPHAEGIASAVLALRNDPSLFEFWKKHPGRFRI